ncbi:uncharacterized [Tachysurus ichikawai]
MCALGCRLLKSLECSSADDYRSANNASVMLKAQIHPQEQVTTFSIISCLTQCPPLPSFPLLLNRLLPSFPVKDNGTAERGSPCNHRFLAALYIKPTPALQRKLACLFPSPHALHALPYRDGRHNSHLLISGSTLPRGAVNCTPDLVSTVMPQWRERGASVLTSDLLYLPPVHWLSVILRGKRIR